MSIQKDHPAFEDEPELIRFSLRGDVLEVAGELDLDTCTDLFATALCAPEPGRPLVLDMAEVTFMDSTAIGVLVQVTYERSVRIINPSEQVRRILELTGLAGVFGLT